MKRIIIVLCVIVLALGTVCSVEYFKNKSNYEVSDKNFYESIAMIKEEKYNEAYQLSNNIENVEDQRTVRNIIAHLYLSKINSSLDEITESGEKSSDIISSASISLSIYGRIEITDEEQNKIDKLDNEIMQKYGNLNTIYSKESLYEDLADLYDSYGEAIKAYDGLNSNLKQKLSSEVERKKYLEDISNFTERIKELSNHIEDVEKLHPVSEIPEQYRIMFELENSKK